MFSNRSIRPHLRFAISQTCVAPSRGTPRAKISGMNTHRLDVSALIRTDYGYEYRGRKLIDIGMGSWELDGAEFASLTDAMRTVAPEVA